MTEFLQSLLKISGQIVVFILWATQCQGQKILPRSITAFPVTEKVKLDGKLDEAFWIAIPPSGQFIQVDPNQGQPSLFTTLVKTAFDKEYLYFGVSCLFKKGENVRITSLSRDFDLTQNDDFLIALDGFSDKRNAMIFATNPAGAKLDVLTFDGTTADINWNGLWEVKTNVTDTGWSAEFAIPWKTLRYSKKGSGPQDWEVNFLRISRAANEISVWSPYARSYDISRMEFAGTLTGLLPPTVPANITVTPYVLGTKTKSNAHPENGIKAGGDLKWVADPKTVLDLTVNPDFAQAEADVQVSNVSRYSVYFPEKRAFFLENASFFGTGLNLAGVSAGGNMQLQSFNSRSIGLDTAGFPVPVTAAGRLVHRSLSDNYGGIFAVENPGNNNQNYKGTFRYARNFGSQNHIGLLTNFNLHQNGGSANNLVNGADLFIRFDQEQSFSAMLLHSSTAGNSQGMAGYAQYFYTNNTIQTWLTEAFVSSGFQNDLGFSSRKNVIVSSPGVYLNFRNLNWLPFHQHILAWEPSIASDINQDFVTKKVSDYEVRIYPLYFDFNKGGYTGLLIKPSYQNLTTAFSPLGIPIGPGIYHYLRERVFLFTDASQKLSGSVSYETGPYFNGKLNIYAIGLRFNPIVQVATTATVTLNDVKGLGIDKINRKVPLVTIDNRLALNPKVLLSGLLQFDNQDHTFGTNIRFSWEYKPLSFFYILFNNVRPFDTNSQINPVETYSQVGFKLSYLHQF